MPAVVRWASSLKLKVELDLSQNEKIYSPYLEITYSEKPTNLIHKGTKTSVTFIMDYF